MFPKYSVRESSFRRPGDVVRICLSAGGKLPRNARGLSLRVAIMAIAAVGILSVPARGQATWGPEEEVAWPVLEVSSGSSPAAVYKSDAWHVVYASLGDIWYRTWNISGWGLPVRLSNNPAPSRDPHIAPLGDGFMVVWEDDRNGHPEIWSRRLTGGVWQPAVPLTEHVYASRHPAIASEGSKVFAIWDRGPDGHRAIRGRLWENGQWGALEFIAEGWYGDAFEPSIAYDVRYNYFVACWSDSLDGATELDYGMRYGWSGAWSLGWGLTGDGGSCRRSSIQTGSCCLDMHMDSWVILYENNRLGVPEVFRLCLEDYGRIDRGLISPNDGIPSRAPCAAESDFLYYHELGGYYPFYLAAWTDEPVPGTRAYQLSTGNSCPGEDSAIPASAGLTGNVLVAAVSKRPFAPLLTLWVELRQGRPTLIARRGLIRSQTLGDAGPPALADAAPGDHPELPRMRGGLHDRPLALREAWRPAPAANPSPDGRGSRAMLATPNPCRERTVLTLPGGDTPARFRILDVNGRVVRYLDAITSTGGILRAEWNTRDDHGRSVPAGVYTAVATRSGAIVHRAVLVLR